MVAPVSGQTSPEKGRAGKAPKPPSVAFGDRTFPTLETEHVAVAIAWDELRVAVKS